MIASDIAQRFLAGLMHDIKGDRANRWYLIGFLSLLSIVSLCDGLMRVMGGWREAGVTGFVMALALSLALQAVLVAAVSAWLRQRDRMALKAYLVCVLVSVPVSLGFWYQGLGLNRAHAGDIYRQTIEHSLDRLRALDSAYESFATTSLRLAAHSEERAQLEAARGGTCDVPLAGPGERKKYRANDSAVLGDYGRYFAEKREALKAIVRDAEALHGAQVDGSRILRMKELVSRANALAGDPRIAQAKSWLVNRVVEGRDGVLRGREFFRCRDSVIEENARALSRITLVALPVAEIPNPSVAGANIVEAFGIVFAAVTLQWGKISSAQWIALIMGVLIDAGIFFLARSMHIGSGSAPTDGIDLDGLASDKTRAALGQVLERAIRRRSRYLVFVTARDRSLHRVLSGLEHVGVASFQGLRPRWSVPAQVRSQLGAEGEIGLYAIPAQALHAWAANPYRVGQPATDAGASSVPADGREELPAGVTPIGGLHGAADRKNHEVLHGR